MSGSEGRGSEGRESEGMGRGGRWGRSRPPHYMAPSHADGVSLQYQ